MSISVVIEGRLWGLIACHHGTPRFLPARIRMALDLFGHMSSFQLHPKIVSGITGLAVIILKYGHSSSPAGVVANAQSVLASPNPPTQAAVQAAQTDPQLPAGPGH